jgi:hypothetical protein
MNKPTSFPLWQQYALGAASVLPWVVFSVLAGDVLPESFRFQKWPESIRIVCVILFCVWVVADVLFTGWYLFLRSHENSTV